MKQSNIDIDNILPFSLIRTISISQAQRKKVEYFITLGKHFMELNNFNCAMAVRWISVDHLIPFTSADDSNWLFAIIDTLILFEMEDSIDRLMGKSKIIRIFLKMRSRCPFRFSHPYHIEKSEKMFLFLFLYFTCFFFWWGKYFLFYFCWCNESWVVFVLKGFI